MNFFASLLGLVSGVAPNIITTAETAVGFAEKAYTDIEPEVLAAMQSPTGQTILSWFGKNFTHTSTPGAAIVVEPIGSGGKIGGR